MTRRAHSQARALEAQPPHGLAKARVLPALRRGPAHGYGIVREFTGCGPALGRGAVYGALRCIEGRGLAAVSYLAATPTVRRKVLSADRRGPDGVR